MKLRRLEQNHKIAMDKMKATTGYDSWVHTVFMEWFIRV